MPKKPQLTGKQELFCKYMFTFGSESFSNGTESARRAGHKGTDLYLAMIASRNIRKDKIIAEKNRIQAKTNQKIEHNRDIAIENLYTDYESLKKSAGNANIQAIQARTVILRELNAISNLHSSTVYGDKDDKLTLTPQQEEAAKAAARAVTATFPRLSERLSERLKEKEA